ncbi:MAG: GAF domain-containing protein [Anaerolineae bacterium]
MSILYLTPASIGYLTQFILASAIAGYFLCLSRRSWQGESKSLPTLLLAGAFTAFACATLLLFLNASLHPDLTYYAMPLESIAVALFLTFLLQFAYRFPSPVPGQKWEARVVLGLTILDTLWEAAFAIQRYTILAQGVVRYRPPVADFPLAVAFLWVAIVFLRQTVRASTGDPQARDTVWLRLWRPRGRPARAARALALLSIMALGLEVVDLLKGYFILPSGTTELIQSLGILFTLSAFALVYLNYLPATTSVMVKLVGVTLATILAILGSVGWIMSPAYVAAYHNDRFIADRQTLRFTPNVRGGYDVDLAPFHFESDLGTDLGFDDPIRAELTFDFPFYGQVWRQVYIQTNGAASFGQALDWHDVQYRYGPLPAIFPLAVDLAPADSSAGGLFVKNTADKLLVTWSQLPAAREREARYTFQLALYPGGAFDITYNGLPASQTYVVYDLRAAPWLIGAVPGSTGLRPDPIRFTADLPYSGGHGGIVEDYYLDFRRYLHQLFLPLVYLIIGSSLLIIVCFPLFFRLNLVKPLNSLLEGVRQINIGNLEVAMPVHYHDEIGFLTQSFNDMAVELQARTQAVRRRAAELEALESVSSALRQAVTSEDMILILVEETVRALGADAGSVLLLDGDALVVAGLHGLPRTLLGQRVLSGDIPCWQALQSGQLAMSDLVEPGTCAACGLCQTLTQRDARTLAVVPLQAADQTLGLLQVAFYQPDSFLKEHRRPLVAIAEMGSNALQRAQTMEMLEQLVQDRTRELTTLYEVTRAATQHLDLQVVLDRVLEKALEVVGGEAGLIHLLDEGGKALHLTAQHGISPELIDQVQAQSPAGSLWEQVVESKKTVIETLKVSEIFRVFSYIGVPIRARGRPLGVLSLFGNTGQDFSVEDIALLAGIADHVGAAVESTRLRQRRQETAVREERRRLARDLHDSVTQSLHSLVLSADTASHLLGQNRPAALQDSLGRLGESARQALKEMRLLLYELRLAPLEQLNLVEVLQIRLEAVEHRAGVEARLVVDGPADWPKAWEGELYCIAMEALNNALRHARATQVSVRLRGGQNSVELEVTDNGRGFDLQQRPAAGMGLHNMAERVQRLGGELVIDSAPGAGTRVRVRMEIRD